MPQSHFLSLKGQGHDTFYPFFVFIAHLDPLLIFFSILEYRFNFAEIYVQKSLLIAKLLIICHFFNKIFVNLNLVYSELKLIFSHDPRAKIFICKGFCTVDTRTRTLRRLNFFVFKHADSTVPITQRSFI